MDLTDQIVSSINELNLQDSLNASLLELKVKMNATTVAPEGNDLIIYVDRSSALAPTKERKQYVFNLTTPLRYCNQVGDEVIQKIKISNNEVKVDAYVNRIIGINEGENYILETPQIEILDSIPITLFEGVNYIYTNYGNAEITVMYPKDNDLNKTFLNNAIYFNHKTNNVGEFSLDDLYFKDAFTKTEDKLNLEVNCANIDCLISRNNKFSLDSGGNLTVKSITVEDNIGENINYNEILNLVYPVGSIYMSVMNINPSTLFGGTWEVWATGKTVVGVDETQTEFNTVEKTGGEKTHKLLPDELPKVRKWTGDHQESLGEHSLEVSTSTNSGNWYGLQLNSIGKNQPHNNIQPYITCYMWKRTA